MARRAPLRLVCLLVLALAAMLVLAAAQVVVAVSKARFPATNYLLVGLFVTRSAQVSHMYSTSPLVKLLGLLLASGFLEECLSARAWQ